MDYFSNVISKPSILTEGCSPKENVFRIRPRPALGCSHPNRYWSHCLTQARRVDHSRKSLPSGGQINSRGFISRRRMSIMTPLRSGFKGRPLPIQESSDSRKVCQSAFLVGIGLIFPKGILLECEPATPIYDPLIESEWTGTPRPFAEANPILIGSNHGISHLSLVAAFRLSFDIWNWTNQERKEWDTFWLLKRPLVVL